MALNLIATIIIIFLVVLLWYCFNFNEIEEILEYRTEKKEEIILNDENTNNLSENLVMNNILDKLKKIQTDIDELKLCKNVEDCKDDTRDN
tara:strand:+ start:1280 stop:1552 length:273 start_codon:yes stop_codon:yes gene_type:complete